MGMKQRRKQLIRDYGSLYTFHSMGDRMACAYCGDVRETVDHIPALAVVDRVTPEKLRENKIKMITVPCCRACNQALSYRMLGSYEERLGFLYKRLLDKAQTANYWTAGEIEEAEIHGELKRMIEARSAHTKREILVRLRGMEKNIADIEGRVALLD
jgi:hypothetical protein